MADAPLDLTGEWNGTYAYPGNTGPATPFLAAIEEQGGTIHGRVIEPGAFQARGRTLNAVLEGHRSGRSVDFRKSYTATDFGYDVPVDYVGQLSADGLTITGVWSLPQENGTFEMHRDDVAKASQSVEVRERVRV